MNIFYRTPNSGRAALLTLLFLVSPISPAFSAATAQTAFEGEVVDADGAPVIGAEVVYEEGGRRVVTTRTGADGAFRLSVVARAPATAARVLVRAPGFADYELILGPASNLTTELPRRVVLAPAALSEQIIVSASRAETRLSDTAASVLVLAAGDLERTPAVTLDDALRQVPGFTLFRRAGSRTANPTTQGVSLRGVGASGASRALVLADGVPLNDPFGGWVYWGRVPREQIAQVEILRGGASDLYGSAGLGGVINVITARSGAAAARPSLALAADYGNQNTPNASAFFDAGRYKNWGASVGAEIFRTDGYVIIDEAARGRVDTPADSRRAALNVTLERFFGADEAGGRAFLRGNVFGEARGNGTPLQTNRTHVRQTIAGGEYRSPATGSWLARAYFGTQVYDQDFTAVAADRNSEALTRGQRVPAQSAGTTLQWARAAGARQSLVAGFDWREVRGASDERVFGAAGRVTTLVGAGGRERTFGFYAQDVIRARENLFLTVGGRYDRWRNYRAQNVTRPVAAVNQSVTAFPDRDESAFSPRLSLLYKSGANVAWSASAYRAFRAPTLNELYRSFRVGDALTQANERLRAERLTGGEVGVNAKLWDAVSARGVLFWSEITRAVANVTLAVTPGLITRQRQNLGRTRSRGIEVEVTAPLGARWALSGGYALTDAVVREFPANRALEGLLIPQIARHQLTVQARYDHPRAFSLSVQGRAAGEQFDDDQNNFRLEPYFVLDALMSRRVARGVELFVAAENVLNRRYSIGRTPLRTIGPPTLARAGVRFRFGAR